MVEEEEEEEEEDDDDEEEEDGTTTGAVSPVPEGRRRFISQKRKNVLFSYPSHDLIQKFFAVH